MSALWSDASSQLRYLRIISTFGYGLCSALAGIDIAFAQIPGGLPGAVEPGRDRPPLSAPAPPNFDFRIETPSRSSVPRAVDEIRFRLDDIQVKGAATLSPDRFRPLYQDLIGKDVSLSDVLDVANAISEDAPDGFMTRLRAEPGPSADQPRLVNHTVTFNTTSEGHLRLLTPRFFDPFAGRYRASAASLRSCIA